MPKKTLRELQKSKFLTVINEDRGIIEKIVAPNNFQIGTDSNLQPSALSVYGRIVAGEGVSGSLTQLKDGTSYLIAGTNVTIASESNGAITISSTGAGGSPGGADTQIQFNDGGSFGGDAGLLFNKSTDTLTTVNLTGSLTKISDGTSYLVGGTNIEIATSSNGQVTISGGKIGESEDGSYTDGLFTDFTTDTTVGIAVDRFNEVLKGLAPGAAPSLDDIEGNTGVSAKLSFGNTQSVSGYTNARPSTLSSPSSNLSDVDINSLFESSTVSNDMRLGVFNGNTIIRGNLNDDVAADTHSTGEVNYPADAFGDGDQGTLKIFVNNSTTEKHSVDLSAFGSGATDTSGTGFNLSAVTNGKFSDGSAFSIFKHRTGTYTIAVAHQRDGWNYAFVTHTVGSSTSTTNYIEWVNDPDANALSATASALGSLSMSGNKTLSGARYHTAGTATYTATVINAYKDCYSTSNITFNGTNLGNQTQSFPTINTGGGENEAKSLSLSQAMTINADPVLNGTISTSVTVPHPIKTDLSSAGSQSIAGILLYNLSNTSTVTQETFRAENFRLISGSYDAQAQATSGDNTWDSSKHMSGSNVGHTDGLLFYNSKLVAPKQGGVSGDFRNTSDGGSIANGPGDNVNYSGITSGLRTFYRYFQNNSGGSKSNFSLAINGSGTIVTQITSLDSSRLHVLLKLPTNSNGFETGWMDIASAFVTGKTEDGDGCLDGSLDSSLNATNNCTFGTQSVGSNEYILVKIEADAAWTGNISQMTITWT